MTEEAGPTRVDHGLPGGHTGGTCSVAHDRRPAEQRTGPACVLVGPPGAGKSTVGPMVAAGLGVPFRDTDADIEREAGKTPGEIFVEDGEERFRDLERAAVATALAEHTGVLAVGGGAILTEATRTALHGRRVVYLEVGLSDAINRIGLGTSRPLLAFNPRATLRHLMDARRPLYEDVATVTVATDGLTPDEVAAAVLRAIADLPR